MIGPFPPPLTGNNIANVEVDAVMESDGWVVRPIDMEIKRGLDQSIGKVTLYKLAIFKTYLKLHYVFSGNVIYCSIGQSFLGIVKYAPFIILATILGKEKIVHLHGNALNSNYLKFSKWQQIISKWLLSRFDKAIVLSESMKANFNLFLPMKRVFVCWNFSQTEATKPKDRQHIGINILFLSNLLPAKGIEVFLDAMDELIATGHKVKIKIAGVPSTDRLDILGRIANNKQIEYCGVVAGGKKSELYDWADVFCMPTLNKLEGQPLVILEALSHGCFIIASNVSGISDVLSSKNGDLIEPIDENLIDSILKILNSPETLVDVENTNRNYCKNFSQSMFRARFLDIINSN
ncbi:glycosyltransferase family 4 protein [Nonlabens sp. Hel1_33_55]|uniref:glycosyltransferase family 4 protein n=1 Tax=Nonlabens sp. Hel1_33_55 TaxID=1336802 RepID=UPI0012FDC3EB|nr:glycosyltransferase family 4 protein [Nonlabens sp. Hel1_33_55]